MSIANSKPVNGAAGNPEASSEKVRRTQGKTSVLQLEKKPEELFCEAVVEETVSKECLLWSADCTFCILWASFHFSALLLIEITLLTLHYCWISKQRCVCVSYSVQTQSEWSESECCMLGVGRQSKAFFAVVLPNCRWLIFLFCACLCDFIWKVVFSFSEIRAEKGGLDVEEQFMYLLFLRRKTSLKFVWAIRT